MAESLATLQRRWADHVRDPSMTAPEGVEARRLAVYRRLCIDSLDSLLAGSLPRLQHRLGTQRWRATVEHYYARHACHTPLFPQIAAEFAHWLAAQDTLGLPGWAAELAHYESTQQALHIEAREAGQPLPRAAVGTDVLALSAHVRVLGYQWPVHRDDALAAPSDATPTLLLLQRHADFSVHTQMLAPLAYALLTALGNNGARVDDALGTLAANHGVERAELQAASAPLLADLCAAGVLVAAHTC